VSQAAFTGHHLPFIGFTHSADTRYSDGAAIVVNLPTERSDCYEETIDRMKSEQNLLSEEFQRLKDLYESTKIETNDQKKQMKTLEDQFETTNKENFEFLTKIFQIFHRIRSSNSNSNEFDENFTSFDDLKSQLTQQMIYFSTFDEQKVFLKEKSDDDDDEMIKRTKTSNENLKKLLNHFETKFGEFFSSTNTNGNEFDETIETTIDDDFEMIFNDDLTLRKFSTFLNEIFDRLKTLSKEKNDLDEKYFLLEEKRLTYSRWENQMYDILKWINEEKSARSHLKGLANKMAEELDQIRENTNPLLMIGSNSSSMTTAGMGLGHNTAWKHGRSVKLKHMEIQQLQTSLQKEIEAKQKISDELKECQAENILKNEENLRLKDEIEKLQKQLLTEQTKSSPIVENFDELSLLNNKNSIDRFLRNVTAGLSETTTNSNDQSANFDDGSSGGDDSSRTISTSNKIPSIRPLIPLRNEFHDFMIANFHVTAMCDDCQNALIGIVRQGFVCQRCKFICHPDCMEKITTPCRPSAKDRSRTILLDQHIVRIPKAGGIKKGWTKYQLLNLQTKLLFYELTSDKDQKITWPQPAFIIDLTDEDFAVSPVNSSDAFHANKKDVSSIFKISVLKLSSPKQFQQTMILTNNETEKVQYVNMLTDLSSKVKTLKQTNSTRFVHYIAKELFDISKSSNLKESTAATILDSDRILLCGDDGLYLLDIAKDNSMKLTDKKVHQLSLVSNNELLVTLSGKQRTIRLQSFQNLLEHPLSSNDTKIIETKNATSFALHSTSFVLCVAIKNRILIYQLFSNARTIHHSFLRELNLVQNVTYLDVSTLKINDVQQDFLWYGYPSTFIGQRLDQQCPSVSLLRDEDPTLQFFRDRPIETLRVVPVHPSNNELLLVFRELGVYVSSTTGMRTRHRELMWTALPISTGFSDPNLLIFTDKSIDIYDVPSGTWVQSFPLSRTRSLTSDGSICLSYDVDLVNHHPKLLYLISKTCSTPSLNVPERSSSKSLAAAGRGGKFRTGVGLVGANKSTTSSSIAPISGPKDFTHISHLGKGEGLQILSGLKQISPTNTLASRNESGGTLNHQNLANRRSLISGPQNFVHLTHIGPSDISTFASDLTATNSTTNKAVISAPMNFRHQVHIGHQDDIETLNSKKSTKNDLTSNSVDGGKQLNVTSSGNSTLSSRSISFKDEQDENDSSNEIDRE